MTLENLAIRVSANTTDATSSLQRVRLDDDLAGEKIHAPDPFLFVVWLSTTEETCVDEDCIIHRIGGLLWHVPRTHPGGR